MRKHNAPTPDLPLPALPRRMVAAVTGAEVRLDAAWQVRTESGSLYLIARDESSGWWFTAANVPNVFSVPVPSGLWAIEPPSPWLPRLGAPMCLLARLTFDLLDPERIPGGGKYTSLVRAVTELRRLGNES